MILNTSDHNLCASTPYSRLKMVGWTQLLFTASSADCAPYLHSPVIGGRVQALGTYQHMLHCSLSKVLSSIGDDRRTQSANSQWNAREASNKSDSLLPPTPRLIWWSHNHRFDIHTRELQPATDYTLWAVSTWAYSSFGVEFISCIKGSNQTYTFHHPISCYIAKPVSAHVDWGRRDLPWHLECNHLLSSHWVAAKGYSRCGVYKLK